MNKSNSNSNLEILDAVKRRSIITTNSTLGQLSKRKSQSILNNNYGSKSNLRNAGDTPLESISGPMEFDRLSEKEKIWFEELSQQLEKLSTQNQNAKDTFQVLSKQSLFLSEALENEQALRRRLERESELEKTTIIQLKERLSEAISRREDIVTRFISEIDNEKQACRNLLETLSENSKGGALFFQSLQNGMGKFTSQVTSFKNQYKVSGSGTSESTRKWKSEFERKAENQVSVIINANENNMVKEEMAQGALQGADDALESKKVDEEVAEKIINSDNNNLELKTIDQDAVVDPINVDAAESNGSDTETLLGSKEPSYFQGLDQIPAEPEENHQERQQLDTISDEAIQKADPIASNSNKSSSSKDDIIGDYKDDIIKENEEKDSEFLNCVSMPSLLQ